jgi:hypothetical protein
MALVFYKSRVNRHVERAEEKTRAENLIAEEISVGKIFNFCESSLGNGDKMYSRVCICFACVCRTWSCLSARILQGEQSSLLTHIPAGGLAFRSASG